MQKWNFEKLELEEKLKKAKWVLSGFFIVLGLLSMVAFLKIGYHNFTAM